MLIEEYFLRLEQVLTFCPQVAHMTLTKEKRAPYLGFVKGEIVFSGGIQLFIMEFVHTEPGVIKTKYRYHCQDATGNPLFRYDNAPHHPIETFPHHKHTFSVKKKPDDEVWASVNAYHLSLFISTCPKKLSKDISFNLRCLQTSPSHSR